MPKEVKVEEVVIEETVIKVSDPSNTGKNDNTNR
jgi:hypothetical protein